tara:strand:- start:267 stop:659 length:393 start_codon:yes stop_codon:yes gene_type:complete
MVKTPKCPQCDSIERIELIVYGYPSPELKKAAQRNEVSLGGCTVGEYNCRCGECGHRWWNIWEDRTMEEKENSRDKTFRHRIDNWFFNEKEDSRIIVFFKRVLFSFTVLPLLLIMFAFFYIYLELSSLRN